MTYIENIFICIAIPMILSMFFTKRDSHMFTLFVVIGMGMCVFSAYVSSFFMGYYDATTVQTAVEISPVCEELMKLFPLLFFYLIFEPQPKKLPFVAIAIGVGFATLENICYLTENGAANFHFLLVRGISAGALHILCGIFSGFGISYVFCKKWLMVTGTVAVLGVCVGFHGIYNLLITADGAWQMAGYLFPSLLIIGFFGIRKIIPKMNFSFDETF